MSWFSRQNQDASAGGGREGETSFCRFSEHNDADWLASHKGTVPVPARLGGGPVMSTGVTPG